MVLIELVGDSTGTVELPAMPRVGEFFVAGGSRLRVVRVTWHPAPQPVEVEVRNSPPLE